MSVYLVKKVWGYQTVCPDEEAITGYYKAENPHHIRFYTEPYYDAPFANFGETDFIWGWEEVKDEIHEITWVRLLRNQQVWAPINKYDYSSDDIHPVH